MSNEYTPTTEQVRDLWENSLSHGCANREAKTDADWDDERMIAQFDRWLERVRAEAQVEALREFAEEWDREWENDRVLTRHAGVTARDRADRIAREAGIETGEKQ